MAPKKALATNDIMRLSYYNLVEQARLWGVVEEAPSAKDHLEILQLRADLARVISKRGEQEARLSSFQPHSDSKQRARASELTASNDLLKDFAGYLHKAAVQLLVQRGRLCTV